MDEYNNESRKAYIEQSINGFAHELYLLDKHQVKQDISIDRKLWEFLDTGFNLTPKEEKAIMKKAIKISNKIYGLKI